MSVIDTFRRQRSRTQTHVDLVNETSRASALPGLELPGPLVSALKASINDGLTVCGHKTRMRSRDTIGASDGTPCGIYHVSCTIAGVLVRPCGEPNEVSGAVMTFLRCTYEAMGYVVYDTCDEHGVFIAEIT